MNKLQEKLLSMLTWFDSFCRENKLRYFILGGTMLGAARHKGFIPWDDDIDVGMPREDYERFCKQVGNQLIEHFFVETVQSTDPAYSYTYTKIFDTNTTLIENIKEKLIRGVFLDVFPLDGIGDSEKEARRLYFKLSAKLNFYSTRVCAIRKGRSWWKNLAVYIMSGLPIINNRALRINIDRTCKKRDYDASKWVGNLMGAWGFKELMPKSIMGKPREYCFEGLKVFGAEDFDGYLTHLYGDWRKLPPKDKQISHHDYLYMNLQKSYLED